MHLVVAGGDVDRYLTRPRARGWVSLGEQPACKPTLLNRYTKGNFFTHLLVENFADGTSILLFKRAEVGACEHGGLGLSHGTTLLLLLGVTTSVGAVRVVDAVVAARLEAWNPLVGRERDGSRE